MPGTKEIKRTRKDSGYEELSPGHKGAEDVFFPEKICVKRPETLEEEGEEEEEDREEKEDKQDPETKRKYFIEEGFNTGHGPKRIIVKDITKSGNIYRTFVEERDDLQAEEDAKLKKVSPESKSSVEMKTVKKHSEAEGAEYNRELDQLNSRSSLVEDAEEQGHNTPKPKRKIIFCVVLGICLVPLVLGLVLWGTMNESPVPDQMMTMTIFTDPEEECFPNCLGLNVSLHNAKFECRKDKFRLRCQPKFIPVDDHFDSWMSCDTLLTSNPSLTCTAKGCAPPASPAHGRTVCSGGTTIGSFCKVECEHGTPDGQERGVSCEESLTWSALPSCLPPPCSPLNNSTGSVACTQTGQHCMTTCQGGRLTQLSSCHHEGRWDTRPCSQACRIPPITHGHLYCSGPDLSVLFSSHGAPVGTSCHLVCNSGFQATGQRALTCGGEGEWSRELGSCKETMLVLLGGRQAGEVVSLVETFPPGVYSLPPLPKAVKMGSAGFVNNSLLVCGGETALQNHNRACWKLHKTSGEWTHLTQLDR